VLFNSFVFLYLFLPITYGVFWQLKSRNARYVWLTATGYVFYAFWNPAFCLLMAFSTLVSYTAGLGFLRWQDPMRRRLCLVAPIAIDLSLLGFFKYFNFVLETVRWLGGQVHVSVPIQPLDIILPVGISFYTFHTITYIVDSYRGVIRPTRNLFEFTCYVSLFCQLVAGPIVRFRQIEADLDHIDGDDRRELRDSAWSFFAIGLIKKVLIADTIAALIDPLLAHPRTMSTATAWACALGYTFQLYFDFSGYSDMAVGLGRLFGLRLPQNFASPYKAQNPSDFWRRWHISLSSVLRDYLFIPLGGSRDGELRAHRNVLVTMLLGGLWHGANWTFVVWGGYHGMLLVLHRLSSSAWQRVPALAQIVATFVLAVIGWVLFRAPTFTHARAWLHAMFNWRAAGAEAPMMLWAAVAIGAFISFAMPNTFELTHDWRPAPAFALTALFSTALFVMYIGHQSPFLYFQF
jgi:alginate O-acetyltransferase complex protein AlgI